MPLSNENPARSFHLEEWKSLREEIATNLREGRDTERYVIIACVAVWVWVLKERDVFYLPALAFPPALAVLGAWRSKALTGVVVHIGRYLREVEIALGSECLGWEEYFHRPAHSYNAHDLGRMTAVLWAAIIISAVLISALIGIAVACGSPHNAATITYTVTT